VYRYEENSNRLSYIENHPKKGGSPGNPNFMYDPNGNMVIDKSKNLVITYDWRDMAVSFRFYSRLPDLAELNWSTLHQLDSRTDLALLSEVIMIYDADGNRVLKTTLSPKGGAQ
jgi:hypothetical protein